MQGRAKQPIRVVRRTLFSGLNNPRKGILGAEQLFYWPVAPRREVRVVEIVGESLQVLEGAPVLDQRRHVSRTVGTDGSVGIWHETYAVEAGHHETIYNNMLMFGLVKATEHVSAKGRLETARRRISRARTPCRPLRSPLA
jgi:hypothetical protein